MVKQRQEISIEGVGRLTWLKAFDTVEIESSFSDFVELKGRAFSFTIEDGVTQVEDIHRRYREIKFFDRMIIGERCFFGNHTPYIFCPNRC